MAPDNLEEFKNVLKLHDKRITALENLVKEKPERLKKEISIKEFILEKKASNDVEKTLVVGYFLEHHRKVSPFNIDDLKGLFREAKESLPININATVNYNIAKGFIMEAESKKDNKKAWTLTGKGERFVENGLKEEI